MTHFLSSPSCVFTCFNFILIACVVNVADVDVVSSQKSFYLLPNFYFDRYFIRTKGNVFSYFRAELLLRGSVAETRLGFFSHRIGVLILIHDLVCAGKKTNIILTTSLRLIGLARNDSWMVIALSLSLSLTRTHTYTLSLPLSHTLSPLSSTRCVSQLFRLGVICFLF